MGWSLGKTMSWSRGCTEVFLNRSKPPSYFHFVGSEEKWAVPKGISFLHILVYSTSRPKFKTHIWISNSVGAKIFRWHLGINSFCANSDLRRNCTLSSNYPAGTSEFTSFWRQLGSPLGMKIPGDSFSGIPICFCWRFRTNFFWPQLGSSLEFSRWRLEIHSVWRQIGSPLGSVIPGYSLSGIPPCFPLLGFTLLIFLCGTTFSPVGGLLLFSFLG